MTGPILSLDDVVVEFPGLRGLKALLAPRERRRVQAVAGISLDVYPGETVAIVGESGSGKTTLARAVNGLVPLAGGEVWFDGTPLHENPDWHLVRRRVAMMFQDPAGSLSPRKTVRDLVLEPFAIHGIRLADPPPGRSSCWPPRGWTAISSPATRTSCPAGRRGASAWRVRWRSTRRWCWPTSRRRGSTFRSRARS